MYRKLYALLYTVKLKILLMLTKCRYYMLFVFCSARNSPTPLAPILSPNEKVEAYQRSVSYDSVHLITITKSMSILNSRLK